MGTHWAVLTCTHGLCFEQKYKKYPKFSENFQFLHLKKSLYIAWAHFRNDYVMKCINVSVNTSISFYKKLGLRFAYINLNVKESDRTPISSWFM